MGICKEGAKIAKVGKQKSPELKAYDQEKYKKWTGDAKYQKK